MRALVGNMDIHLLYIILISAALALGIYGVVVQRGANLVRLDGRTVQMSLIWAALLIVSLVGLVPMIGTGGTVDITTPGGVLSIVSVFLSLPALIGVIWSTAAFVRKDKQHKQHAAGAREPFAPPSEESMSHFAAYYMNKQAVGEREYLSIEQVKRMSHAMPF